MPVTTLMHTLPQNHDDDGPVIARPSKPSDCACNALSPNTLYYGERCAACPFAIWREELFGACLNESKA